MTFGGMKIGELARVVPITNYPGIGMAVKAWDTCPDQHGFHRAVWVGPVLALLLEHRDVYWRILVPDGGAVWVEHYRLKSVE